ncbi:MAG TPA: isoprenylcysteine carboxylmethyltransferase family protein [Gemmatimonadaceae bacterium]|jgi:protein-S-isoprenylcysteine O-methyltransferase Ste14
MTLALLLRHAVSIAILPFTVAVAIPVWLARRNGTTLTVATGALGVISQIAGILLLAIGLVLFVASLSRFASEGKGTLAPWDPPRQLVLRGPYRYVRNPMISGVIFVLFGEALLLQSRPHFDWALTFLVINLIYIPLLEEPGLKRRFGEAYVEYCRHVRRFIPRLKPWNPG